MTEPSSHDNQHGSSPSDLEKSDMKHIQGDDVGAVILNGTVEQLQFQDGEDRSVLWKIDRYLLPILAFTYMIQFLDKSCISYAALWGMKEDAHLVNDQYSWLTTIFYLGYMAGEFPINFLFQKFDIARTCGIFIILWGTVLLCMTAGHDFAGLATTRVFLGILEAGVSPCFVLLTAMFYRRSEQPLRTSIWFSMNGVANIIGGLIAYGIGHINSALPAWKYPFVIFGSVTILWGIVFVVVTPSNPTKAKWLSTREKEVATLRVLQNETGIDNKSFKMDQVKESLLDIRFWLINLLCLANTIPNGAVSAFAPLIVNGFGFSKFNSTLLGMPSGASQVLALWISGYLASRFNGIRHFLMIGGLLVALLGAVLIFVYRTPIAGYYLLVGFSATFVISLTLLQSNVAGRTKKTIFTSAFFVSYCVGNLIGPQLFFEREAPRYQSGFASMIACFAAQIVIVGVMYVVNARENRRRDRLNANVSENDQAAVVSVGLSDMTDVQNLHFRYVL
ncbi:hypothetical protein N7509_013332 [Penicillium cosmopolitanum]|uniref:Major facilitator superfamily (MFS) profile domain-containing protein n=1 Tax=Penicillium cosmopolitanum TaxID=1131564 RepID=A0A9W9SD64_9EURO|nr:uncharacterized protein N7509_013332 [Penicillium cosmopolitanum]KAJ5376446.1 hypothetical protein N7509_013332 [Penicillium cosmopolitanum]